MQRCRYIVNCRNPKQVHRDTARKGNPSNAEKFSSKKILKGCTETLNETFVTCCLLKLGRQFIVRDCSGRLRRRHGNFVHSPRTLDSCGRPRWTRPCPWLGDGDRRQTSERGGHWSGGTRDRPDAVFGSLITTASLILLFIRVVLRVLQPCN